MAAKRSATTSARAGKTRSLRRPTPTTPTTLKPQSATPATMTDYEAPCGTGINATEGFREKKLAEYAVNVGYKCGHDCAYCSSAAMYRHREIFKKIGRSAFDRGYSLCDPEMPDLVAHDARTLSKRGKVMLCTTTDAWSPEARRHNLGAQCLKAILSEPDWTVRILTKNHRVQDDFPLIKEHRDRVQVGISITAPPSRDRVIEAVEPFSSSNTERLAAMKRAHKLGLRTYAMLCPLLPGIADDAPSLETMIRDAESYGAEEVYVEPVNPRGRALTHTVAALNDGGLVDQAEAVNQIRKDDAWWPYTLRLLQGCQKAMRKHSDITKLRFLLYTSSIRKSDGPVVAQVEKDPAGVIWL